jgi:hypothetical protein
MARRDKVMTPRWARLSVVHRHGWGYDDPPQNSFGGQKAAGARKWAPACERRFTVTRKRKFTVVVHRGKTTQV